MQAITVVQRIIRFGRKMIRIPFGRKLETTQRAGNKSGVAMRGPSSPFEPKRWASVEQAEAERKRLGCSDRIWKLLLAEMQVGDEIVQWSTSPESWEALRGSE